MKCYIINMKQFDEPSESYWSVKIFDGIKYAEFQCENEEQAKTLAGMLAVLRADFKIREE